MRFVAAAVSLLLAVSLGVAESPARPKGGDIAGHWSGALKAGNTSLQVLLHINHSGRGLVATLDSLDQNETGIPVEGISYTAPHLRFAVEHGAGVFEGTLDEGAAAIAGTWKQSGETFPLTFTRATDEYVRKMTPHTVRVAFVVSDGFNMIDFAGPWEVFQDAMDYPGGKMRMLMSMYTVSASRTPIRSSGGATLVPQYTFADAPRPDIVVVGAQLDGSARVLDWLRRQNAAHITIMSVCTGASKLAASGLLDGHPATTHHEAIANFKQRYPRVEWETSRRWVKATENVYTAAGLTSGIDLALHMVEGRFGREVAQATADYMEYHGADWKAAQRP